MAEHTIRQGRWDGTPWLATLPPRLVPGQQRAAVWWNIIAMCGLAAIGAALVHVLTFHILAIPPGPRWGTLALALLVQCPLFGPLGLIAAFAVLAPLLAFRETLRLERLNATLAALVATRRASAPPMHETLPRSSARLAGFFVALLALQGIWSALAALVCPMSVTMVMGGVRMTMTASSAWPLTPLHLLMAALLALALWRLELRLTRLRSVARRLRALLAMVSTSHTPLSAPFLHRTPHWFPQSLFARPPPASSRYVLRGSASSYL